MWFHNVELSIDFATLRLMSTTGEVVEVPVAHAVAAPELLEVAQAMCEAIPAHGAWSPKLRDHLYALASAAVRKAGHNPGGMIGGAA